MLQSICPLDNLNSKNDHYLLTRSLIDEEDSDLPSLLLSAPTCGKNT